MSAEPSEHYRERVAGLDKVVRHCIAVSHRFAGIQSPTTAHYFASLLFTALCSRGVSLAIVAPHSTWSQKLIDHWDHGSMAIMVRSILEIRLAFFYLCIEQCTREEWSCRWNLFNLHDCTSRRRLFEGLSEIGRDDAEFDAQAKELRSRLLPTHSS